MIERQNSRDRRSTRARRESKQNHIFAFSQNNKEKKNIKNLLAVLLVFGAFYAGAAKQASAQAAQDFTLVNKTGVEIYALYVTPHNADDWGDDILGIDTLLTNRMADITFSRTERAKLWDLRVEDEDGSFIEWEKLNLLEISKVTLYYNKGKATAVVE